MRIPKWLWIVFAVVAVGQWGVPAWMIAQQERVLREGVAYKFRTQPVDPVDVFRGRYVALALEPNSVTIATNVTYEYQSTLYVTLGTKADGYAEFTGVSRTPPPAGDYLAVKAWHSYEGKLTVQLPFDRYYMEETSAPAAERAYQQHSRRGEQDAHVIVRVLDGRGVLEELYVAGQPIRAFLQAQPKE